MSGFSAPETFSFLHHLGPFLDCEAVHVHCIGVSLLSGERERSSGCLLSGPLSGLFFSSSEDSLHSFEVILKAGSFLKPLVQGFGGGVATENLSLKWEREGFSEEVREGGRYWDLGL